MLRDSSESFCEYNEKMNAILLNKGTGKIDSVHFDLGHTDLNIEEWGLGEIFNIVLHAPGAMTGEWVGNPIGSSLKRVGKG